MAVSMKVKETLVQKSAFPKPPINLFKSPVIPSGLAHTKIIKKVITQALITQAVNQAFGPDKIYFKTL